MVLILSIETTLQSGHDADLLDFGQPQLKREINRGPSQWRRLVSPQLFVNSQGNGASGLPPDRALGFAPSRVASRPSG